MHYLIKIVFCCHIRTFTDILVLFNHNLCKLFENIARLNILDTYTHANSLRKHLSIVNIKMYKYTPIFVEGCFLLKKNKSVTFYITAMIKAFI